MRRWVAVVLACGAAASIGLLGLGARAQTSPGAKLDIIMRSGEQRAEYPLGWRGISADSIDLEGRDLSRYDVRIVCPERCPSDLPPTEVADDTVVWKMGRPTRGHVEVTCGEDEGCIIRQNGLSRPWGDVRYLQLRPSLGGCFARLEGRRLAPFRPVSIEVNLARPRGRAIAADAGTTKSAT